MNELNFTFSMPDDESLAKYISIQGEKGERGDPTKTSQLENDSDFTTNAALNAGLATKANASTVQAISTQVNTNKNNIATLNSRKIIDRFQAGTTPKYALITTLWARGNSKSAGSIVIHGRIGGYLSDEVAHVDITIATRATGLQVRGSYYQHIDPTPDDNIADVVVYHNEDGTDSVYLYARGFVGFDLDVSSLNPTDILYDGTWSTTEPTGTLDYSLLADNTYVQKNKDGTIYANITGDAGTVNGHTVATDVPSGAVFTDTVYDDSAIQAELDTKANTIDVASNYATKTEVQSIASGSPLVASSTSEMTDTTRTYVNTSDGNWYYYDGSAWVSGGVYQSVIVDNITSDNIAENGIMPTSLANFEGYDLSTGYHQYDDYLRQTWGINDAGKVVIGTSSTWSITQRIPKNSFITVKRSVTTGRFKVGLSTTAPANGMTLNLILNDPSKDFCTFYSGNYEWVMVQYTISNEEADISVIVESYEKIANCITAENLLPFEEVDANTNLYNPKLKLKNIGTGGDNGYPFQTYGNLYSYKFALEKNLNYTIEKTGTSNRFRVTLYNFEPQLRVSNADVGENALLCRPSKIVVNDNSETQCTFNSGNYKYCIVTYQLGSFTDNVAFNITADGKTHKLSEQWYSSEIALNGGVYNFTPAIDASDSIWSQWSARLAFGMNTATAPVPVQMDSQLYVNGTIIAHNTRNQSRNRWGFHVYEAYASDNYSRMTMLLNKHDSEFDSKPSLEYYYYTGASHKASSYGNTKIGSDVKYHSFLFNRDEMIAAGHIDCRFPVTLARINTTTDLDGTYETIEAADNAYEPENYAAENIKCLKYIYLKDAEDGCMWYDTVRNKVVVKINGKWHDLNTTEVPEGTYNF